MFLVCWAKETIYIGESVVTKFVVAATLVCLSVSSAPFTFLRKIKNEKVIINVCIWPSTCLCVPLKTYMLYFFCFYLRLCGNFPKDNKANDKGGV